MLKTPQVTGDPNLGGMSQRKSTLYGDPHTMSRPVGVPPPTAAAPMSGTPPFMKPMRPQGGSFARPLQNDFSGMDSGGESGLPWEPQAGAGNPANTAAGMGFSFGAPAGGLPLGMGGPMSGGLPVGMGGPMSTAPAAGISGDKPGGVMDMAIRQGADGVMRDAMGRPIDQGGGFAPQGGSPQRQALAQLLANPASRGGRSV